MANKTPMKTGLTLSGRRVPRIATQKKATIFCRITICLS